MWPACSYCDQLNRPIYLTCLADSLCRRYICEECRYLCYWDQGDSVARPFCAFHKRMAEKQRQNEEEDPEQTGKWRVILFKCGNGQALTAHIFHAFSEMSLEDAYVEMKRDAVDRLEGVVHGDAWCISLLDEREYPDRESAVETEEMLRVLMDAQLESDPDDLSFDVMVLSPLRHARLVRQGRQMRATHKKRIREAAEERDAKRLHLTSPRAVEMNE